MTHDTHLLMQNTLNPNYPVRYKRPACTDPSQHCCSIQVFMGFSLSTVNIDPIKACAFDFLCLP